MLAEEIQVDQIVYHIVYGIGIIHAVHHGIYGITVDVLFERNGSALIVEFFEGTGEMVDLDLWKGR